MKARLFLLVLKATDDLPNTEYEPQYNVPSTMDQFQYLNVLEEVMQPYAEEEMTLKWVCQQNNDP